MFLTLCSPKSANPIGSFSPTCSRTEALTQISPGAASASIRAATLTPSPNMSPSSTITSPTLMPIRKRMRSASGVLALRSSIPFCTTTAQRTASTTEANSISMPSPVVLKMRPRCWSISGSINSRRWLFRATSVFSSSTPISREYSTTSAQRIAASRRSTRSSTNRLLPYPALFRQAQPAQRLADRLPDLGPAGMCPNKAGNRKARLQFEHAPCRGGGLLPAVEDRQCGGLQDMGEAEARIGPYGVAAGRYHFLPVAGSAMGDSEPHIGIPDFRVQRADAERTLSVFDRLRGSPRMTEDDRTVPQRPSRRGRQRQCAINGVHRGFVVMVDQANDKASSCERRSIVGAGFDCSPRVMERGLLVRLVQPTAHVAVFMGISCCGIGRGEIWLKREGFAEQLKALISIARHGCMQMGQGTQVEIVGVEAVRTLALSPLDLCLAQARLDRANDAQRDLVL